MFFPVALTIPLGSAAVHLGGRLPLLAAEVLALAVAASQLRRGTRRSPDGGSAGAERPDGRADAADVARAGGDR